MKSHQEFNFLKRIIKDVLGINVEKNKSRLREVVNAKMIYAMDPSKQKAKKVNLDDINPYYIYEDKVEVPGSYLTNVKTNLNAFGKKPLGQASNYGPLQGIRA